MKIMRYMAVIALCAAVPQSFAAMITNGDFSSCDFSAWSKDTDGFGDVSSQNDFAINGSFPDCRAAINAEYADTEVFFANTLFQEMDLSATPGNALKLSFDIALSSELTSADSGFVADYMLVGLNDGLGNYYNQEGLLGTLFAADIDGAASYSLSFMLDPSFANKSGWFLDFQLNIGADNEGQTDLAGSSLYIDNVTLEEMAVPAPPILALFAISLGGIFARRRKPGIANNPQPLPLSLIKR